VKSERNGGGKWIFEENFCEVLNTPEIVMSTKIPKEICILPFAI
jgi:hypothetical protein